jgi:hypothetical protein
MKKTLVLLFVLVFCVSAALAEQQTLISGKVENSGYGGVLLRSAAVKDKGGIMLGGEGAWLINRTFFVGGAGVGMASNLKASDFNPAKPGDLTYAYGGIKAGMIINSDKLTHPVVHLLVGYGSVGYTPSGGTTTDKSNIMVIEPGIDYEINIAPFFRVALGASYRMVTGVDSTAGLSNSDLGGLSLGITLKWGGFGDNIMPMMR